LFGADKSKAHAFQDIQSGNFAFKYGEVKEILSDRVIPPVLGIHPDCSAQRFSLR
jgi:hypothetical protein